MLRFDNVSFAYEDNIKILNSLSFSVDNQESLAIVGPNGAGKTTLMKAILGLVEADGNISLDNNEVSKSNLSLIRKEIGYVSQNSDAQLFMPTVLEDMIFGLMNYGKNQEDAVAVAEKTLEELDVSRLMNRRNSTLSSGEKRMVSIATVLAMEPTIMLLDEPSSNLDLHHRRILVNTLNKLDIGKIIATHDLDLVLETCDRVILLNEGRIVADGPSLDILSNRKLLEENGLELPLCIAGLPDRCKEQM